MVTKLEQNTLAVFKELTNGVIDVCADLADAHKKRGVVGNWAWNDACTTIADAIRDLKKEP